MATNFMRSSAMSSLRRAWPEPVAGTSSMIPSPLPDNTGMSSSSSKSSNLLKYAVHMTTRDDSVSMIAEADGCKFQEVQSKSGGASSLGQKARTLAGNRAMDGEGRP